MLLRSWTSGANYDPYRALIEWEFLTVSPHPTQSLGYFNQPSALELSDALHEFTHSDTMYTEMGIWYLHLYWKFISQTVVKRNVFALMLHDRLMEAYWLTQFLHEGFAMYVQLHLHPSSRLESTTSHFAFLQTTGIEFDMLDRSSARAMARSTPKLFEDASRAAHQNGVKSSLICSRSEKGSPYLLGYLFFRNAQAYLSHFDSRLSDPEFFAIFMRTFLFNNFFQHYGNDDLHSFDAMQVIITAVRELKRLATKVKTLVEPIATYPRHSVDFHQMDYIASSSVGENKTRRELNTSLILKIEDLMMSDADTANLYSQAVVNLQFVHLKSSVIRVIGIVEMGDPFLMFFSKLDDKAGVYGQRIDRSQVEKIRELVTADGGRLLTESDWDLMKVAYILPREEEFYECEVHLVMPADGCRIIGVLATETDSVVLRIPTSRQRLDAGDNRFASRRGISREALDLYRSGHEQHVETMLWHLDNSEFVRSVRCRERIVSYFMDELKELQSGLHQHMVARGTLLSDRLDPLVISESARARASTAFAMVVWSRDEIDLEQAGKNVILEIAERAGLLSELEQYCLQPPISASGGWRRVDASRRLREALGRAFSTNVFHRGTLEDRLNVADII